MPVPGLFHRHTISMYPLKKRNVLILLVLACILCLSIAPAARGFIVFEHEGREDLNTLVKKVHADHWVIHYSYGDNCPPEEQNNDAALTDAVTEALQMWLQPLREYTDRPIVNDFRYKLNDDWQAADFGITFYCNIGASRAFIGQGSPGIKQRATTNVERTGFMTSLLHEMGHIFGLADTYTRENGDERWLKRWLTKGGLDSTRGTQPSSIMMGASRHREEGMLGKDDKNGIVYLYKLAYEGLSIRDCFFSDYQLEHEPLGCVPKHPLIFEIKHVSEIGAIFVLRDDENIDVNAQDDNDMTALHYAVLHGYDTLLKVLLGQRVALDRENILFNHSINVNAQDEDGMTALHYAVSHELDEAVEELLAHKDILPFLRNTQGHSPLQITRENKLERMIHLLLDHPLTLPVNAKGKLATTWGHLKKQY